MKMKAKKFPMKTISQELQKEAISSSARLFYILVTMIIIYVFAGINKIDRNEAMDNLRSLSIIHALILLSEGSTQHREMPRRELTRFHSRARAEVVQNGFILPDKFDNRTIQKAGLHEVPMRFAPVATCEISVVEGEQGVTFFGISSYIAGGLHRISSENSRLVSFGRCIGGYGPDFHAWMFKDEKGDILVGLPESFQNSFPKLRPPKPAELYVIEETDEIKSLLPLIVQDYLKVGEPFVLVHIQVLRHVILQYAAERRGVFYSADELGTAVSRLFEEVEARTGFIGINATNTSIIRFGPIVIFIIAWELWRRVRRIEPTVRHDSTWFPFDVQFPLAVAMASAFALAPFVSALLVTYFFIESQELGIIIFDRMVTLSGILTFDFPMAPGPGWISTDYWALALIPLFVTLVGLLLFTSFRLLAIIRINARKLQ